ncbi:BRCT domain-containing protein [Shewanella inventionis]|uniref:BRCT domain-containing protein n=1 Tax=Shewanella inventionis TaxID=1738770 RepID=UPI001CC0FBF7|nr:BRCT domain-containing protein [Shewanella inventionis]UAL44856.1 BRCT domain-containing protein [Shewanella inventionis]
MTTTLDKDGQPYSRMNFKGNKQKALCSLKGLLTGIVCDTKLKPTELLFLNAWLKDHEFLHDDPDSVDLIDALEDVLEDGIMTDEEHEDIFCLVEDVIAYKELDNSCCKDHVNVLLGILKGISADEEINESEVLFLEKWLSSNPDISDVWPVPLLTTKIAEILEDGIITSKERAELYQLVNLITGNDFNETGDASDNPTQLFDIVETITHKDYGFCFTGKFRSGTRSDIETKASNLGAIVIKKTPTLATHYVVVGSLSSRDWAYSSHGRKIELAKTMQAKGHKIYIISEDQWLAAI